MLTLKEFITKINAGEHYRIYQPNRDCLIFESYFKIHSPYKFETDDYEFNINYFENNNYCDDIYQTRALDKETKIFLKRFGKYVVTHLEIGEFRPCNLKANSNVEDARSESRPNREVLPCFNVFIVPKVKEESTRVIKK